jgi:hypothetical protein
MKIEETFGFKYKFNQISNILAKFHQKVVSRNVECFCLHKKYCFKRIFIDSIPLFDVYDFLSEHLVS